MNDKPLMDTNPSDQAAFGYIEWVEPIYGVAVKTDGPNWPVVHRMSIPDAIDWWKACHPGCESRGDAAILDEFKVVHYAKIVPAVSSQLNEFMSMFEEAAKVDFDVDLDSNDIPRERVIIEVDGSHILDVLRSLGAAVYYDDSAERALRRLSDDQLPKPTSDKINPGSNNSSPA